MDLLPGEILLPGGGISNLTHIDFSQQGAWKMSTYQLFRFDGRGVTHIENDEADKLSLFVEQWLKLNAVTQYHQFYLWDGDTRQWWYYCNPVSITKMIMVTPDPWQKRHADGVPKSIRAYQLLLG